MTSPTLRNAARFAKITLASLVVAACVTINVYFPAAAAEKAADQVIDAITGATAGANRVCRGGSWIDFANQQNCSMRASAPADFVFEDLGFRCVRSP